MANRSEEVRTLDASDVEHMAALVTGGLLVLLGQKKGGMIGALFKLGGLGLVYRGQQGYRRLYDLFGLDLKDGLSGVGSRSFRVESEVTVRRPREELYRIWRNLENLPVFMDHLIRVEETGDRDSHWVARAPAGMVIAWDSRIVNDIENELIAWETIEGSGVDSAGSVHFTEDGEGSTRLRVLLRYEPPADLFGAFIAKVFGSDPQRSIDADLRRFKRIMEIGPIIAAEKAKSLPARRGRREAQTT